MSHYPDDFRGRLPDERRLNDDDFEAAVELDADYDALFAIGEARTAFRAAVIAQLSGLSATGQKIITEYLKSEFNAWHDEGVADRLQAAVEVDL